MKGLINLFRKVWRLLNDLYRDYKWRMLSLSGLGLISGFLEGIGITLLIPLFTLFVGGQTAVGSNSFTLKFLQSFFTNIGSVLGFKMLLVVTVAVFLFKAVALYLFGYIRIRITASYKSNIRRRMYAGFLNADYSFLRAEKMGHLDYVIMAGVKQSAKLLEYLMSVILSVGSLVMYLVVAFALSPVITIVTLIAGAAFLLAFKPFIKELRRRSRELILVGKQVSHTLNETLVGIKTVKSMGVESKVLDQTSDLFDQVEAAELKKQQLKNITKVALEPFSVLFIVIVFAVSYLYLKFDVVAFVSIIYLINRMFAMVDKIQSAIHIVSETLPEAVEVSSMFKLIDKHSRRASGSLPFSFNREISFENVSFGYDKNTLALSNINFKVKRGETLGIIGPSGAGKTTIVDLILRLLVPSAGKIMVDGKDISEISLNLWCSRVIYVAQDMFLKNDTIAENIRFYDETIDDGAMAKVARQANIYDLIESLPKKFDTLVGERGTRLSGGERQRITLARALARKPAVLILDEATSALDNTSEALIQKTIGDLKGQVTVVLIAHRLSTLNVADRLIVIENGRLIEGGTPQELLGDASSYFSRSLRQASISGNFFEPSPPLAKPPSSQINNGI